MANTAVASNTPFLWEGTDRNGKKVKGKSLATDESQVRADLRRQGVVPTRIRKQSKGLFSGGGKITTGDIAIFSRQLATMIAAGVPLVEALESVSGATGNIVYEEAVLKMRDEVATGQRLQVAMENTDLFPNMVIQMIAVGEESGSLDDMSGKVADFYEEDVDNAVDNLSSLLEPLIMAILGVLVGGLVVAMYLPIFKLGAVV